MLAKKFRITPTMQKIIDYLEIADYTGLTKRSIAKHLGISEPYVFKLLANQDFCKALAEQTQKGFDLVKPALRREVIKNAFSPNGAKDRELLAKMSGMIIQGNTVNVGINNTPQQLIQGDTPQEMLDNAIRIQAQIQDVIDVLRAKLAVPAEAIVIEQEQTPTPPLTGADDGEEKVPPALSGVSHSNSDNRDDDES